MIKIFGKKRYHWQPELAWAIIYWSLTMTPLFISLALLYESSKASRAVLVMFILVVFLFLIGLHRYFIIEEDQLYIAFANPFASRRIKIDSIQRIEVTVLFIKIFSPVFPKGKIYYMRKWPKKYFINDLARNLHFQGEVELTDHLIAQDYFEEYYAPKSTTIH